jgi:NAD(P)-dependent dehydrogenase (short-subunit alcohol dehydrogenase family)
LADRVKDQFGTLDGPVVNAGVTGFAPFESTPEQLYDQVLTINAKGPYFTAQKLIPLLGEGSGIVFATSIVNVIGYPHRSAVMMLDRRDRPSPGQADRLERVRSVRRSLLSRVWRRESPVCGAGSGAARRRPSPIPAGLTAVAQLIMLD